MRRVADRRRVRDRPGDRRAGTLAPVAVDGAAARHPGTAPARDSAANVMSAASSARSRADNPLPDSSSRSATVKATCLPKPWIIRRTPQCQCQRRSSHASAALHSTSYVRAANAAQIVRLLRDHGGMSRAELVRASGLTKPTVMAIVRSLLADGIAIESGTRPGAERGGRPGSLVWFNSRARTAVAARIGLGLQLTHVTAAGAVLAEETFSPAWDPGRAARADGARDPPAHRRLRSLGSVALAVPGFIDHHAGTVTFPPFGWDRVPMQPTLAAGLGVPVAPAQPPGRHPGRRDHLRRGRAARRCRSRLPRSRHRRRILSRGHLLLGAGGAVGELGHCPVSSGLPCRCGRHGCLETVAAGWAIRARAGGPPRPRFAHADLARARGASRSRGSTTSCSPRPQPSAPPRHGWSICSTRRSSSWPTRRSPAAPTPSSRPSTQSTRRHAVSADVEIVRGAPDAQSRGTIQCALELLPEPLRPQRTVCA